MPAAQRGAYPGDTKGLAGSPPAWLEACPAHLPRYFGLYIPDRILNFSPSGTSSIRLSATVRRQMSPDSVLSL